MRIASLTRPFFQLSGGVVTRRRAERGRSTPASSKFPTRVLVAASVLAAGCGQLTPSRPTRSDPQGRVGHPTMPPAGPPAATSSDPILARLGLPPVGPGSQLPGYLMIADRDNNRIIIVSSRKRIVWRFPASGSGAQLSEPDDAFVSAYLLANGEVQVADIINCRVLWLTPAKRIVRSIGSVGNCTHAPPGALSDPNGDTSVPGGGVLVTEIGGWVDLLGRHGRLLWSATTPTTYPSDAQLLPNGNVLVAGYTSPGRVDIIGPHGRVVWTYDPPSGPGSLDHPSLAVQLPNGRIAATDDFNHRVVLIDPASRRIVWQYGHDGVPGSAPGYLDKPDGLELLP